MSLSVLKSVVKLRNGVTMMNPWKNCIPQTSYPVFNAGFWYSSTQADETKSEVLEKLSLKDSNNKRITSEKYLSEIKQIVGKDIPDDKFVPPRKAFDVLATEYDTILQEVEDLNDKYRRALAETENVRRRGQKQVEDAKIYAVQTFCKDLLEVADILELAIGAVKPENAAKTEEIKGVLEGITMTKTVLLKTFEKHGLKKVDPEGEKFDPNLHEAVFEIPKEQTKYEPGQIGVVMKIGYSLHGRPIRPAQVGVVKS
uniref:GrpE protein homolog n=1 Tax=Panagrolaimus sp. JU765 TaxID=591449 RepID=A0AC34QHM2_9BILA